MLGWMIVFALMAIIAGVADAVDGHAAASVSMTLTMVVFGVLFLVCLLTSVVRGRA